MSDQTNGEALETFAMKQMAGMDPLKSGGEIGKRLIPQIIDAYAEHEPDRIWGAQARSDTIEDGLNNITFKQLAHLVDILAWFIHDKIGRGRDYETISYIGSSDLRYCPFAWAAVKCGYQTLLPSTRNSESGNLSLLYDSNCTKFFCSPEWIPQVERLKQTKNDLQIFEIPTIDQMLATPAKHFPYTKTFEEAENDPIICCHTSGSTGAPKPIQLTNHYFAAYDNHRKIPQIKGRGRNVDYATFDTADCAYYYNTFPPFHIAGIIAQGMIPILYNTTVLLGPIHKPPSGEICNEILKRMPIHSIYTPPTVLEQLLLEPGGLERAGQCNFIIFSGGPLAPSTGDQVAKVTDLGQYIGSTEIGIIPGICPSPETWRYFEFHPVFNCELEHVTEDQFELVVPHDDTLDWIRPAPYRIAPTKWRTKDLFKQHPEKSFAYRFHGRADDIVVLGNGEKFNPVTMEAIIQGAPFLAGALIVGQGKFQAALIVEPKEDTLPGDAQDKLVESIWPWVQKANVDGPAHAQIFRSKILLTRSEKPLVRAGKGTIVRQKSTEAYEDEIDALYTDRVEDPSTIDGLPDLQPPFTTESFTTFICAYLGSLLSWEVKPEDDVFVLGMDSLQTNQIVNALKSRLHNQVADISFITPKSIYHHPTPLALAKFCAGSLGDGAEVNGVEDPETQRVRRMEDMFKRTIADLPRKQLNETNPKATRSSPRKRARTNGGLTNGSATTSLTVALTGSTGTLGTNVLQTLLEDPKISKVYCLDRSATAAERQTKSFDARGISHLLDNSKVVFLKASFGPSKFGFKDAAFKKLLAEVDVIIHNAWKVDFNHQLESFETEHIRSIRNLINWAHQSPRHPRILFVSSLSSVSQWSVHHTGPVPETAIDDFRVAQSLGYGESKHVAERILQEAAVHSGVNAGILRVGQIAGSTRPNGTTWNPAEYLPSLIQSSLTLGRVPKTLPGAIDWIPVDALANIIVDIVHGTQGTGRLEVFNIINPRTTSWEDLLPALQRHRSTETPLLPIEFPEWVKLLSRVDVNSGQEVAAIPAAKLLDFYEGMQQDDEKYGARLLCETRNGENVSKTMSALTPISKDLMEIWLEQWQFGSKPQ
jgi:thioester reductase-like protein